MLSTFNQPIFASAGGAFFGAFGAYLLSFFSEIRKERIDAIGMANLASMLSVSIANSMISLKQQHIRPLVRDYERDRERFEADHADAVLGVGKRELVCSMNLRVINEVSFPVELLRNSIAGMRIHSPESLSAACSLEEAVKELNSSLSKRNELIEDFRCFSRKHGDEATIYRYFGQVDDHGNVDELYSTLMDAIDKYSDDIIFFSVFISESLVGRMKGFRKWWLFTRKEIYGADFSYARSCGLIPDILQYASWTKSFAGFK